MAHHSTNVSIYAVELARGLGLADQDVEAIRAAAVFHDIGMVAVGEDIAQKTGPLTPAEEEKLERHPVFGEEIASELHFMHAELPLIRHHHERFDGQGKPDGLAGEAIPLGARILAIADAYDEMVSERPGQPALTARQAMERLRGEAGSRFDPRLVETFVEVQSRLISDRAEGRGAR